MGTRAKLTTRIREVLALHDVASASLEADLREMACKWREEVGSNKRQRVLTNNLDKPRIERTMKSRGLLKEDEYITNDPIRVEVTCKKRHVPERFVRYCPLGVLTWED